MKSQSSRWRPRRIAALSVVGLAVIFAGWLAGHLVPRRDHFRDRRGQIASVRTGRVEATAGNFVSQGVSVTATTGLSVDFRVLRRPTLTRRLPVLVLLGGHRTGRDAVDVLGDPGGVAVVALDYPYRGPERLRGVWQSLSSVPKIQQALLDTPPAVSVVLDWLVTQSWVDTERVELMGVSLGVPFAAVAGAIDSRFSRVWLVHGGTGNRAWMANRLETRIRAPVLRHAAAGCVHLLAHGASFRTEEWVRKIAPRPVVIIGAKNDEQMPRARVEELFAAAGQPKELLWSEGGHVRTDRVDVVRQLLGIARGRIEQTATGAASAR